ncbi:hypothetical protein [Ensifer aridi]|uniref:hypothetical protein n=1 Tax=Ensifer aridi TaxID=1708715 RepID=UPI000A119CE7|nr:hypothetical protein [Ensifer aridi]
MTALLQDARIKRLDAELRCPACGSKRNGATGGVNSAGVIDRLTVFFDCGAIFACEGRLPISATVACPGSSEVAAAALERQATGSAPDLITLNEAARDLLSARAVDAKVVGYRGDLWDQLSSALPSPAEPVSGVEGTPIGWISELSLSLIRDCIEGSTTPIYKSKAADRSVAVYVAASESRDAQAKPAAWQRMDGDRPMNEINSDPSVMRDWTESYEYTVRPLYASPWVSVPKGWEQFLGELETWCCELPDRTSPDDAPEMMLINPSELREIAEKVREFSLSALSSEPVHAEPEAGDVPPDAAEFRCLVPFPDQSPSFVHGYEAGMVEQQMTSGEQLIGGKEGFPKHVANTEVFRRMAAAHGYDVEVESYDDEWAYFTFTKWPKRLKIVGGTETDTLPAAVSATRRQEESQQTLEPDPVLAIEHDRGGAA